MPTLKSYPAKILNATRITSTKQTTSQPWPLPSKLLADPQRLPPVHALPRLLKLLADPPEERLPVHTSPPRLLATMNQPWPLPSKLLADPPEERLPVQTSPPPRLLATMNQPWPLPSKLLADPPEERLPVHTSPPRLLETTPAIDVWWSVIMTFIPAVNTRVRVKMHGCRIFVLHYMMSYKISKRMWCNRTILQWIVMTSHFGSDDESLFGSD